MKYFYFEQDPKLHRASFAITDPGQLFPCCESLDWLDSNVLAQRAAGQMIDPAIEQAIKNNRLMAINKAHPRWQELINQDPIPKPSRLNLIACGDVGSTILIGLTLLARELISEIGIYDIHEANTQRWEFELNQICGTNAQDHGPHVKIIGQEDIFDSDILVFCATAGIPPLTVMDDVRLLQYEKNAKIIREYAQKARQSKFRGVFLRGQRPGRPTLHESFCRQ